MPLEFAVLSHGDADSLYNEFLIESTVMWLVILHWLWQFSIARMLLCHLWSCRWQLLSKRCKTSSHCNGRGRALPQPGGGSFDSGRRG